jgi:hypothetical protein
VGGKIMLLKVCQKTKNGFIEVVGNKEFIPVKYQASKWMREEIKGLKTSDAPQTTNGMIIVDETTSLCGSLVQNAIGYFHNNANSPYYNAQFVGLYSTAFNCGHGLSITTENFMKACALFTARKTIQNTWINHYDEYSAPNVNHIDYQQWNNDAIVYSLFNNSSNQSSLRNVIYKEKQYQIKNEFFFMSNKEMYDLANEYDFRDMVADAKGDVEDRYVYKLLKDIKLSYDAREILKLAQQLVIDTMEYRKSFHRGHPEYNLQTWDAGYRQLKLMWKDDVIPSEHVKKFSNFRDLYKLFEDRLREGVYEFKFLNK